MKYGTKISNQAIDIINNRRNTAKAENSLHFQEIDKKIPEISEINLQLSKTGMKILSVIKSGENVAEKMEQLKTSNLQAQMMIKNLLVQNGYPEDYLKIKYTCEKCEDTGYSDGKRCSCFTELVAKLATDEMNKNSQVRLYSFDSFDINLYRGKDEAETEQCRNTMRRIFNLCKAYAENFSLSSDSLFMFGKTGLGKSHLSLSIAKDVLKKGYSVLYDSAMNYLLKIENEYYGKIEDEDTLAQLLSADLLILDDLGAELKKPFFTSTLYSIINTRINKGLPTIISTNLTHEEMLEKYEERIVSRLFAMYKSFKFVGMDIRLIKSQLGI